MLKLYRSVCTFRAKIRDSVNNFIHHGENQPRQEVEDSYIFVNDFVNKMLKLDQSYFMVQYLAGTQ